MVFFRKKGDKLRKHMIKNPRNQLMNMVSTNKNHSRKQKKIRRVMKLLDRKEKGKLFDDDDDE